LLNIRDLTFSYDVELASGWGLNVPEFSLGSGEIAVISGDNMSGKSTFLGLIAGLLTLSGALGEFVGPSKSPLSQDDLADLSVILSADDKMFPELSVRENIVISSRNAPFAKLQSRMVKAEAFLNGSGVFDDAILDAPLGSLSSGGRALVKLARAHVSDCPLIIVDEISSFLDDARAKFFLDAAIKLVRKGHCLIIVSHSQRDRQILLNEDNSSGFHISRSGNASIMRRLER
jgi:ABC-type multidrug transport system ATPase subunit